MLVEYALFSADYGIINHGFAEADIVFIPFFAPRWLYNKCEREGKLVLLSGVCTLALGVIFACMVVVMAWGEMEDMGGAIGCIGAGLVLIGAHFA